MTVGFIDTGIRYQEPVFRDYAGRSRIRAIWDQTIQTGIPPEGFEYGSEYTNDRINEALQSDNPTDIVPSTDANGHGSIMASLAAGSVIENGLFTGAAPDCDIVMVKLKEAKQYIGEYYKIPPRVPCYCEPDILQAIQYLQKFVRTLYSPTVRLSSVWALEPAQVITRALGHWELTWIFWAGRIAVEKSKNAVDIG